MVASIDAGQEAYVRSQRVGIEFAAGSIALALVLGCALSWSLIGPVKRMDARLREIAAGDFSQHVAVSNRDELGTLAANLNRMNDELGSLYRQLEAASRHKSEFLANMSHELRTPLNAILGYTELITDSIYGEVPPKIREVLERVQTSGQLLLRLINDVLDLPKIEAGQLTLSVDDYSVGDVVQSVLAAVESLAAEKKLALRAAVPSGLPRGRGDERRITQVFLNLVANAIKFTEAGEVRIQATASDGVFLVSVSDTGPGIPEKNQERIFEEFQQADSSSTRTKGGTGLGLSIAKRIIELHGGRMWVESNVGEGLDILVRPADPRRAAYGGLMGRRILVIEDHEENRRILRDLLTSGGYEIIEATTGLEGVDMAEQEHPDLILMDIQLPGIDGYEATRRIKANPTLHRIPIIAVTSYALSGDDAQAFEAGCDAYVAKPFSPRALLAKIREYLPS
jgi:signal transduction histidine kinase/CheY-like chemotaxis protein